MFQFRVLLIWIPSTYVVGGLDDVTFVGDVHGLAFFCGWMCMSQSDSHRCRASRSSWRAVESCGLAMGRK